MELSTLRMFQAVAQTGSVSRAALRLNCVQPNVTSRIRRLESELGAPLFHRKPRGMLLTPAGRTLLGYAERLLALAAEAEQALRRDANPTGTLHVGCTMVFAACSLPAVLDAFRLEHPQVRTLPVTDTSRRLVEKMLAFELDAAVVNGPVDNAELDQTPLFEDELVLVTARGAAPPAEDGRRVALVFPPGCSFRLRLEYAMESCGLVPYETAEVGSLEGILGCVASGLGFTLLPASIAAGCPQRDRLARHPLPGGAVTLPVVLLTRRDQEISPALEAFRRVALATCRLAGAGEGGETQDRGGSGAALTLS